MRLELAAVAFALLVGAWLAYGGLTAAAYAVILVALVAFAVIVRRSYREP